MAATSAVRQVKTNPNLAITQNYTIASGYITYAGTLGGQDVSGNAIPATPTRPCVGVAIHTKGGGWVNTYYFNDVAQFRLPGVVSADAGSDVYALDDETLTLTPNTAIVGQIVSVNVDTSMVFVHVTLMKKTMPEEYWDNIYIDAMTGFQSLIGTWAAQPTTTQAGGQLINTSNSTNDKTRWEFSCHAGTYSYAIRSNVGPGRGIMLLELDGIKILGGANGQDLYSPVAIWNLHATILNITVQSTGTHLLSVTCNGKNASSTGYYVPLTNVRFWRTS